MPSELPSDTHTPSRIGMIWAQTTEGVIGADGGMPWHVPEDLAHFKELTHGHPVIMGRRTWDSFPERFRPLPGRTNIVLSRNREAAEQMRQAGAVVVPGFQEALDAAIEADGLDLIWVIGGATLFDQALDVATLAEVTVIESTASGDTYAPALNDQWTRTAVDQHEGYRFERWERGGERA
ncbi:dihydrofolate reductase [Citricoccus sp. GCM10030269]|uniref:dihydrofolate reductase n=1 Tax=Citricoccus sp. GCM10030269 TaxID=3273388 RepID=UPI003612595F